MRFAHREAIAISLTASGAPVIGDIQGGFLPSGCVAMQSLAPAVDAATVGS